MPYIWLLSLLVLSGCNPFWEFRPTSDDILSKTHTPDPNPTPVPQLYCYKTLAEPQCFNEPQIGAEDRLITHPNAAGKVQPQQRVYSTFVPYRARGYVDKKVDEIAEKLKRKKKNAQTKSKDKDKDKSNNKSKSKPEIKTKAVVQPKA